MPREFTLVLMLLINGFFSYSQTENNKDTAILTFIVKKSVGTSSACEGNMNGIAFEVLEHDSPKPIFLIFSDSKNLKKFSLDNSDTYIMKGVIEKRTIRVFGCGSSYKDEERFYIKPILYSTFIRKKIF